MVKGECVRELRPRHITTLLWFFFRSHFVFFIFYFSEQTTPRISLANNLVRFRVSQFAAIGMRFGKRHTKPQTANEKEKFINGNVWQCQIVCNTKKWGRKKKHNDYQRRQQQHPSQAINEMWIIVGYYWKMVAIVFPPMVALLSGEIKVPDNALSW